MEIKTTEHIVRSFPYETDKDHKWVAVDEDNLYELADAMSLTKWDNEDCLLISKDSIKMFLKELKR